MLRSIAGRHDRDTWVTAGRGRALPRKPCAHQAAIRGPRALRHSVSACQAGDQIAESGGASSNPMSRRLLIAISMFAHLCLFVGLFVSGVWRLERLDSGRARVRLTQPLSPPEATAGGPAPPRRPEAPPPTTTASPKRPDGPRQPSPRPRGPPPPPGVPRGITRAGARGRAAGATTDGCAAGCVELPPAEPVCGDGAREGSEQCDDGNVVGGDGCSATCRIEPQPPRPAIVAPSALQALRVAGETQIHPGELTQTQMVHDQVHRVEAIVKLCITVDGSVGVGQLLRSTGYADYDAALLAAVRDWRYQPYRVNGAPVPACSIVRFVYAVR